LNLRENKKIWYFRKDKKNIGFKNGKNLKKIKYWIWKIKIKNLYEREMLVENHWNFLFSWIFYYKYLQIKFLKYLFLFLLIHQPSIK